MPSAQDLLKDDYNAVGSMPAPTAPPPDSSAPTAGITATSSSAAKPSAASQVSAQRLLNDGKAFDDLMATDIPLARSGNTPQTAMNKSPVSITDRMKLSVGNEAGNIKYLASKFQDVQRILDDKGNPTKDLAVKDGGVWYRVDPKNGNPLDSWEATKEYLKDAAEYGPEAIGVAAAAATDYVSAGAAASTNAATAAAVSAGVRTSLGRLVGTYEATPAEQAWDIGFESLLNVAGTKVMAGVKPTAKYVAGRLAPLAEAFKDTVETYTPQGVKAVGEAVANSPKAIFKKIFAASSVGENNFDTMVEHTDKVRATMEQLHSMSGNNISAYHDEALRQQLGVVQRVADTSRETLSSIYGTMRNKLLAKVPESFSANLDEPVYDAYSKGIERGLGELIVGGKSLTGKDAVEHLALYGFGKGAGFRMYSPEELAINIQKGGDLASGVGTLAHDHEAWTMVNDFYGKLGKFVGGENRTGTKGAQAILDFKKIATEMSQKLSNTEAARSTPELRSIINEAKAGIDNSVFQTLNKHGVGDEFLKLNKTYSELSDKFSPLLAAKSAYDKTGNPRVYENLLNTFLSRPGKNASARFAIDDAISAADSQGLKNLSQRLINDKTQIMVGEAAKAFNPIKPTGMKAALLQSGSNALGTFGLMSQNPYALAGAGLIKATQSPTVTSGAIAGVQGMAKAQEWLSTQTKSNIDKFLSSPDAINKFTTAVVSSPVIRQQTEQSLQQMIQQKMQGGQQ